METRYPFFRQLNNADCGLTCLKMVAAYHGKTYSLEYLQEGMQAGPGLPEISHAADKIGLRTMKVRLTYRQITEESPLPCIINWRQNQFVVLYGIQRSRWRRWLNNDITGHTDRLIIGDPSQKLFTIDKVDFLKLWSGGPEGRGVSLLLDPTPEFEQHYEAVSVKSKSIFPMHAWLHDTTEAVFNEARRYDYIYNTLL